jgi:hypothetical protein
MASGDCKCTRCCCVQPVTQCERCELRDARDDICEELECRKSGQGAVQEVLVFSSAEWRGDGRYLLRNLPFTGTRLATRRQIDRQKLGKHQKDER